MVAGSNRKPPALLERPKWSDEEGRPVIVPDSICTDSSGWKVDVNPSTDSDGWLYGSVFKWVPPAMYCKASFNFNF